MKNGLYKLYFGVNSSNYDKLYSETIYVNGICHGIYKQYSLYDGIEIINYNINGLEYYLKYFKHLYIL